MTEPEIRYCMTEDGVRIAYAVAGEGPPHVFMSEPVAGNIRLMWAHATLGALCGVLSKQNTLVGFDVRGTGSSDRVLPSRTPQWVRDLEAVVNHLGLDSFALTGMQSGARAAITFAATNSERVRKLVLIDAYAHSRDLLATPQAEALTAAAASDWQSATEMIGAMVFGPGRVENVVHGELIRQACDYDFWLQHAPTWLDIDPLIERLIAPTLILRHKASQLFTAEMSRDLAVRIKDAKLVEVDGLWADNVEGLAQRIVEFINRDVPVHPDERRNAASGVRTVLFTDIVGHTEMMQRLGDQRGRVLLREYERITRDLLKEHAGAEVKTMGDGFMASFGSVTKAIDCAIALQRAFSEREGEPLQVRVGLNAGEPIEEDGDLFGSTVIMASRIAAKASAGEILIPEPLRHLLAGKDYIYADRGETLLKGFEDAVRLYEVRWRE